MSVELCKFFNLTRNYSVILNQNRYAFTDIPVKRIYFIYLKLVLYQKLK